MKRPLLVLFGLALAAAPALQAHDRVYWVYNLTEMTGVRGAAASGFGHGVEMGFKELNRSGGVITRRLVVVNSDSESNPRVAAAGALDAIDNQAYAVLGPLFAETIETAAEAVVRRGIPIMIGGEDPDITQRGNPFIFRAMMSKALVMGKLARHLKGRGIKTIDILWVKDSYGTNGHDAAVEALGEAGIAVGADIATQPAQVDLSAEVAKVKGSPAEAVLVYLNDDGAIRALREFRKAGLAKSVFGTSTLVSERVIDGSGGAANGVQAFVEIASSVDSPVMKGMRERYRKSYRKDPDEGALCGFAAAYIVKAVTEKVGNFNTFAFVWTMKNLAISAAEVPEIFVDLRYDGSGEIERGGFIVEVRDNQPVVVAKLPLSG